MEEVRSVLADGKYLQAAKACEKIELEVSPFARSQEPSPLFICLLLCPVCVRTCFVTKPFLPSLLSFQTREDTCQLEWVYAIQMISHMIANQL